MTFDDFMHAAVEAFEAVGVLVLVLGGLTAFVIGLRDRLRGKPAFKAVRRNLGQVILLGLEILIVADIILTITIESTTESAVTLGIIVLVRTFLSFSLEIELDGVAPWRRAALEKKNAETSRCRRWAGRRGHHDDLTVAPPDQMTAPSATGRLIDAIPLAAQLRAYERPWLRADVLAALTVWALLVPQALAYGQLAGMDPVVGLYAALGAIVGYALIGGVREMSVGPEATIALLTVSVVAPLAGGDPARYAALAAGLALVTGIVLILGGLARLGFISRYLSRPLLTGYVAGSAIVMIVSQLDSLLGISLEAQDDTLAELTETIQRLPETDTTTLIVGLATMAVVLIVRRIDRRLPAYLFAVLAAIAASAALGLADQGVAVVGEIPAGLPPIGLPALGTGDISMLVGGGIAVAVLVYADSGVTGQVLARRGHYGSIATASSWPSAQPTSVRR